MTHRCDRGHHGACGYCSGNRLHRSRVREQAAAEALREALDAKVETVATVRLDGVVLAFDAGEYGVPSLPGWFLDWAFGS